MYLISLMLMFQLFTKTIPVEAVQKGKHLDKAIEKDLSYFLDCRLHNPPRKALVGMWLIFFEDEQYVYWGKPKFKRLFSDKRVLEELYKTDKKAVQSSYPQYQQDFFSLELKNKIREAVQKHESLKDGVSFRSFNLDQNTDIRIESGVFIIKAKGELVVMAAPHTDNPHEIKNNKAYIIRLKVDNLELLDVQYQ